METNKGSIDLVQSLTDNNPRISHSYREKQTFSISTHDKSNYDKLQLTISLILSSYFGKFQKKSMQLKIMWLHVDDKESKELIEINHPPYSPEFAPCNV